MLTTPQSDRGNGIGRTRRRWSVCRTPAAAKNSDSWSGSWRNRRLWNSRNPHFPIGLEAADHIAYLDAPLPGNVVQGERNREPCRPTHQIRIPRIIPNTPARWIEDLYVHDGTVHRLPVLVDQPDLKSGIHIQARYARGPLQYAKLMGSAKRIVCMTFAFNLEDVFLKVLAHADKTLRYAVFDKHFKAGAEDEIEQAKNTVIAAGAKLEPGDLENFIGEHVRGFNSNLYIHDKFMLVDPLGDDPVVVTGSANFSGASQAVNDENMDVIRGNTRVADIYFGEFMRIFDHLYSRYVVRKIRDAGTNDPDAGFLKEDAKA